MICSMFATLLHHKLALICVTVTVYGVINMLSYHDASVNKLKVK